MSDADYDLATQLPRYAAPPELRAAVRRARSPERRPRGLWWAAALSAAATAMAMGLLWFSALSRALPTDSLDRLVRSVVSEHTRTLIWGDLEGPAFRPYIVPAALSWLLVETGIGHSRAFIGDGELRFVAGDPVYLEGHRGVALHYKDYDGHRVSYVVLPGAGLAIPARARKAVGPHQPALIRSDGFAVWVWKDGELACFLVSDLVSDTDLERFKTYFLRIRETTQPFVG